MWTLKISKLTEESVKDITLSVPMLCVYDKIVNEYLAGAMNERIKIAQNNLLDKSLRDCISTFLITKS